MWTSGKESQRHATLKFRLEANDIRARLERTENAKREVLFLEQERIRLEKEEIKRVEEEERQRIERETKTKEFFNLNHAFRKVPPKGSPLFYGDNKQVSGAWRPHGQGDFYLNESVKFTGQYKNGVMDGIGTFNFGDGSSWEGLFVRGRPNGPGWLTSVDGHRQEAIIRNDVVVCVKDDLKPSKQVEFDDPKLLLSSEFSEYVRPRGVLLRHVTKWRYFFRFHDEISYRDREVDLSTIRNFRVLQDVAQVYGPDYFGINTSPKKVYNYSKDVHGEGCESPRLGVAVGRRTAEMTLLGPPFLPPHRRASSTGHDNLFESGLAGNEIAIRLDEQLERKKIREKQWAAIVDQKRAEYEQSRKEQIEKARQEASAQKLLEEQREKEALRVQVEGQLARRSRADVL